jgi:monofunctional glycosyltransferase
MVSRESGRTARRLQFTIRSILVRMLQALAVFMIITILPALALRWLPLPSTAVMMERRLDSWWHSRTYRVDYQWMPLKQIAPSAALAVVAAEDQNFAKHHGFDFDSIQKALDVHEQGRRLRGASTISQQVAKNVFLWSGRSFVRKGLEAYFTVLIELSWSKRRILEVYLNIVELGDGLFGVEAASRRYFRKSAAALSPDEAALLAAVLPNPLRLKAGKPSEYVKERQAWILQQMQHLENLAFLKHP